jgi:5-methylcytosine-specific restriction enzyme subunit McrC
MRTDIVLQDYAVGRRIVIDTKFNALLTSGWHRDETIRSGYIYQIYAYLRSQERADDPLSTHASGLLLHPSIGTMIDESAVIQGHEIRFATVDLAADATTIRAQLLRLLTPIPTTKALWP